jgi:WD40 repeat protein
MGLPAFLEARALDGAGRSSELEGGLLRRLARSRVLRKHHACVNTLSWSADGEVLLSAGDDTTVHAWRPSRSVRKPATSIDTDHFGNIFSAMFVDASCERIVSCAADGFVSVFATATGKRLVTQQAHRGEANKLAIPPPGSGSAHVVHSCGADGLVCAIDMRTHYPTPLLRFAHPGCSVAESVRLHSITANPVRPHEISVCGNSPYAHTYDLRFPGRASSLEASPLHWFGPSASRVPRAAHAHVSATGVAVSRDGRNLLLSYSAPGGDLAAVRITGFDSAIRRFDARGEARTDDAAAHNAAAYDPAARRRGGKRPLPHRLAIRRTSAARVASRGGALSGGEAAARSRSGEEQEEEVAEAAGELEPGRVRPDLPGAAARRAAESREQEPLAVDARLELRLSLESPAHLLARARAPQLSIGPRAERSDEAGGGSGEDERAPHAPVPSPRLRPAPSGGGASDEEETDSDVDYHDDDKEEDDDDTDLGVDEDESPSSASPSSYDEDADAAALGEDGSHDDDDDARSDRSDSQSSESDVSDIFSLFHGHAHDDDSDFPRDGLDSAGGDSMGGGPASAPPHPALLQTYTGHINLITVKEVTFGGSEQQFVLSGSDDGGMYIWDRESGRLLHRQEVADRRVCNCVQPRPGRELCIATSGIDKSVKLFEPIASPAAALSRQQADEAYDALRAHNRKLTWRARHSLA